MDPRIARSFEEAEAAVTVEETYLQELVLEQLILEGYQKAAEAFCAECGMAPPPMLQSIQPRVRVRDLAAAGRPAEALRLLRAQWPTFCEAFPELEVACYRQAVLEALAPGPGGPDATPLEPAAQQRPQQTAASAGAARDATSGSAPDLELALSLCVEQLQPLLRRRPQHAPVGEELMQLFLRPDIAGVPPPGATAMRSQANTTAHSGSAMPALVPSAELQDLRQAGRCSLAAGLNAAVLRLTSSSATPRLPLLLPMLSHLQGAIGSIVGHPGMASFGWGRTEALRMGPTRRAKVEAANPIYKRMLTLALLRSRIARRRFDIGRLSGLAEGGGGAEAPAGLRVNWEELLMLPWRCDLRPVLPQSIDLHRTFTEHQLEVVLDSLLRIAWNHGRGVATQARSDAPAGRPRRLALYDKTSKPAIVVELKFEAAGRSFEKRSGEAVEQAAGYTRYLGVAHAVVVFVNLRNSKCATKAELRSKTTLASVDGAGVHVATFRILLDHYKLAESSAQWADEAEDEQLLSHRVDQLPEGQG